jgi:hypothetical protein
VAAALVAGACSPEPEVQPSEKLSAAQVEGLPADKRVCYAVIESLNSLHEASHAQCRSQVQGGDASLVIAAQRAAADQVDWELMACLAVGKRMSEGARIGLDTLYLRSDPKKSAVSSIAAHFCRDLHRRAMNGRFNSEAELRKEMRRYVVSVASESALPPFARRAAGTTR